LSPVDILHLIDQEVVALGAPAAEQGRAGFQQSNRPGNQIVEVEPAGVLQGLLIGEEGAGDRPRFWVCGHPAGRDADLQFEPAEGVVEPADCACRDARPHVA
jgi:hypothetical protein